MRLKSLNEVLDQPEHDPFAGPDDHYGSQLWHTGTQIGFISDANLHIISARKAINQRLSKMSGKSWIPAEAIVEHVPLSKWVQQQTKQYSPIVILPPDNVLTSVSAKYDIKLKLVSADSLSIPSVNLDHPVFVNATEADEHFVWHQSMTACHAYQTIINMNPKKVFDDSLKAMMEYIESEGKEWTRQDVSNMTPMTQLAYDTLQRRDIKAKTEVRSGEAAKHASLAAEFTIDEADVPNVIMIKSASGYDKHALHIYKGHVAKRYNGSIYHCPMLSPSNMANVAMVNKILDDLNLPEIDTVYAYNRYSSTNATGTELVAPNKDHSAAWVISGQGANIENTLYIRALSFKIPYLKRMDNPTDHVRETLTKFKQLPANSQP